MAGWTLLALLLASALPAATRKGAGERAPGRERLSSAPRELPEEACASQPLEPETPPLEAEPAPPLSASDGASVPSIAGKGLGERLEEAALLAAPGGGSPGPKADFDGKVLFRLADYARASDQWPQLLLAWRVRRPLAGLLEAARGQTWTRSRDIAAVERLVADTLALRDRSRTLPSLKHSLRGLVGRLVESLPESLRGSRDIVLLGALLEAAFSSPGAQSDEARKDPGLGDVASRDEMDRLDRDWLAHMMRPPFREVFRRVRELDVADPAVPADLKLRREEAMGRIMRLLDEVIEKRGQGWTLEEMRSRLVADSADLIERFESSIPSLPFFQRLHRREDLRKLLLYLGIGRKVSGREGPR